MEEAECIDCGKLYRNFGLDMTFPDEQWEMICPDRGGILCANCILERASKLPNVIAIRAQIEFSNSKSRST